MLKVKVLVGEERLATGTGAARAVRNEKKIPAIIYGGGKNQAMISLPEKELSIEYNKSGFMSHLFDLEIGSKKYRVVPKQIQLHPVTDRVIHADFVHVGEHDKIKVFVPIEFTNRDKCIGIKHGGVLNAVKHEIELLCRADSIPSSIEIDITNIEIGHSLHLKDIILPKNVEPVADRDLTIATIIGSTKESAPTATEAAVTASAAEKK